MKRIFHASVAAAAFALLAGGAMAQSAAPAGDTAATPPAANAPAATTPGTIHQSKELGEIKQTPAEKKAAHEKKEHVTSTSKSGVKHTAKQQTAAAPKAGKHVEKNADDAVASQPAKKL